jgi:CDP-diacylglycerol--glycerol-3-phosphate 3-phosphatidyltransferase
MTSRATEGSLFTGDERARIKRIGEPIALLLGRLGFTPDALTVVGFGIVLAAAFTAAAGQWVLTALILIFGTLFDGLDGTLARATGKTSDFGAFLDSTMDRAGEAVIYAGIAAGAAMSGKTEVIGLATLALGTGSLVSYVRARGEGLGVCANIGIAQRAERAAVLIVGLLAGGLSAPTWLTAALLIISVASAITVVQRIRFIRAGLAAAEQAAAVELRKVSPRQ